MSVCDSHLMKEWPLLQRDLQSCCNAVITVASRLPSKSSGGNVDSRPGTGHVFKNAAVLSLLLFVLLVVVLR